MRHNSKTAKLESRRGARFTDCGKAVAFFRTCDAEMENEQWHCEDAHSLIFPVSMGVVALVFTYVDESDNERKLFLSREKNGFRVCMRGHFNGEEARIARAYSLGIDAWGLIGGTTASITDKFLIDNVG